MRNLKRVLSLALASVMLMGMMVMGAGAAESKAYSDQNSITKKEAVAVMSGVGVFQGADGKFNPTGVLTRESAAKIITYMVMGKEAADSLTTTTAPFKDVAADRWSAGSVAYCVSQGIISGDGLGSFYPEKTVNGYAFAKMILGALGYKSANEYLTGTGWESNVAKLAQRADLTKNLTTALSKDMTREEAAQMAFNGMNALTVSYSGGGNIDLGNGQDINMNATREDSKTSFAAQNYSKLKSNPDDDSFGRPGTNWKFGTTNLGTFGTSALTTFTAETKESAVKTALGGATLPTDGITPVMNSKDTTTKITTDLNKKVAALTENGRAVEIYADDDNEITAIVVNDTYYTTVSSINTVSETAFLKGAKDQTFVGVTKENSEDLYNALVDLGKDAKVLIVADVAGEVLAVAEPETASGNYSAKNADGVRTIGGTKYTDSFKLDDKFGTSYGTSFTIYLDTYGYTIGATEEEASAAKTAYVKAVDSQGSASVGLTHMAQMVFEDGTQEWVEVAKVGNKSTSDLNKDEYAGLIAAKTAVTYSLKSDGAYNLTKVATGTLSSGNIGSTVPTVDTAYAFTGLDITKGSAAFFSTTVSGTKTAKDIMGSSKTIFLVQGDSSFSVYTGVKNVPNMTNAAGTIVVSEDTKTASMVVISTKTNAVDSSSLIYIVKSTGSEYNETVKDTVFTFDAIVKGEVTTLTSTVNQKGIDADGGAITAGLYTASFDANDYTTALVAVTTNDLVKSDNTAKVNNGTITLADKLGDGAVVSHSIVTADDFKAFVIDKDGKAAEIDVDNVAYYTKQDKAIVILDSDKDFATTLIVVETPKAP